MPAPLILIHNGDSDYLSITLQNAKQINPDIDIYLIGDAKNKKYEKIGINHVIFDNFIEREYYKKFRAVYKLVGGSDFIIMNEKKKNEKDWTEFNFLKWHVLEQFCIKYGIHKFWTFDSDVLYCRALSSIEKHYKEFDYSTANRNFVMQGLVNNLHYLKLFTNLVIERFSNEEYINELIQNDFVKNPTYGFTMMRVFAYMKNTYAPHTFDLYEDLNGLSYDPCICIVYEGELTYPSKINGQIVKKLFIKNDIIFQKSSTKGEKILFAINMSWVPNYYIKRVSLEIQKLKKTNNALREIEIEPTLYFRFLKTALKIPQKIRFEINKVFIHRKFL